MECCDRLDDTTWSVVMGLMTLSFILSYICFNVVALDNIYCKISITSDMHFVVWITFQLAYPVLWDCQIGSDWVGWQVGSGWGAF